MPSTNRSVPVRRPTFPVMVSRAARLRCPWCDARPTFVKGWFSRHDRCPSCGIGWRREEGFELGAVTVNTIITFGLLTVAMVVGFVLTVPDVPVLPFVLALLAIGAVVPVVVYPFTYTLWLAFDLAVHPPEPAELESAAASVAASLAGSGPGSSAPSAFGA
jgi:uncharacterized protein (DUF983 family)